MARLKCGGAPVPAKSPELSETAKGPVQQLRRQYLTAQQRPRELALYRHPLSELMQRPALMASSRINKGSIAKTCRLFHNSAQIRLGEWFPKQRKTAPIVLPTRQQEDLDSRSETPRPMRQFYA